MAKKTAETHTDGDSAPTQPETAPAAKSPHAGHHHGKGHKKGGGEAVDEVMAAAAAAGDAAPAKLSKLDLKFYEKELVRLQIELVKLHERIRAKGSKSW